MSEGNSIAWREGAPPKSDDGRVVLVILRPSGEMCCEAEHCGEPVAVHLWGEKLKTTAGGIRLSYDDVIRWAPPGVPGESPAGDGRPPFGQIRARQWGKLEGTRWAVKQAVRAVENGAGLSELRSWLKQIDRWYQRYPRERGNAPVCPHRPPRPTPNGVPPP